MTSNDGAIRHSQVTIGDSQIHVAESGDRGAQPFVFLHGWPEASSTWTSVMQLAGRDAHAVAIDLPGIGGSTGNATDGSKQEIAGVVHELVMSLGLSDVTLVGHDIGGMVTYAYLRRYDDLGSAVIMDVPIPGIAPWDEFIRQPFLWHFALHSVPGLPERLVQGRQREYFDYFYSLLSANPAVPTPASRSAQAGAYGTDAALTAGFDWYRAFPRDVEDNTRSSGGDGIDTPLLYLRGGQERGGDISSYVDGLRQAGIRHLEHAVIDDAGHFVQEEAAEMTWRIIAEFARR